MGAATCGLPEYRQGNESVYAARITAVIELNVPGLPGCKRLIFGDLDKVADVLGYWVAQNSPQVGAWFVVPMTGGAAHMADADFNARFTKVE